MWPALGIMTSRRYSVIIHEIYLLESIDVKETIGNVAEATTKKPMLWLKTLAMMVDREGRKESGDGRTVGDDKET